MLIIAGAMSIYEFSLINKSVEVLIDDNYKTIEASKTMIESLEREDSGILLLVSGNWKKGRTIMKSADSLFLSSFNKAKNNLTEENEDKYIEKIEQAYLIYKEKWELPIVSTYKEHNIDWYLNEVHDNFLNVKSQINALIDLNETNLHKEATSLKEQSRRAIMPGIIAIISALVFLLLFNFFINLILVRPIKKIKNSVKGYNIYSHNFNANISNNDDLKELETEIQNLIARLQQKKK